MPPKLKIWQDTWIPTTCGGCYASCAIKVRVVNGVAVQVQGNPDSPHGYGGICPKAIAQLQLLYKPNRYNYPLRRTGEKGVGADPKWQRISWDEAMEEIVGRLKKIREENPRKLILMGTPSVGSGVQQGNVLRSWGMSFGTPTTSAGGAGIHCGDAAHMGAGMNHCAWDIVPDWEYCNYHLCFGSNLSAGSGRIASSAMRMAAKARARGMKVVSFDPMCNFSGGKATEWVPLIPGTDGLVALAMANVLVNELGIYDTEYLKAKTNAPYLVKPDGLYVRDAKGEPLLWDTVDKGAKAWNEANIKDAALFGSYQAGGVDCQPAFAVMKEHLRQYTPEWASEVSTVPAETIRRIAAEFGENARIGSTIEIKGVKLPLRPVAATMYKGGQGHTNGFHTYFAIDLLNHLMGAADVPGGCLGLPPRCFGYPTTRSYSIEPIASDDGFLRADRWITGLVGTWPHPEPKEPELINLVDLFTMCSISPFPLLKEWGEVWNKFGAPFEAEMMIIWASNAVMTAFNPEVAAEFLNKVPFIVSFNIVPNETCEGFADIVLPDVCQLERLTHVESEFPGFNYVPGFMADWAYHLRQPVVKPAYERRDMAEVLNELAHRVGFTKEWHQAQNRILGADEFKPDEEPAWEEMVDRWLKVRFGPEHDLDWFKQHGLIKWEKTVEEAYWRWFVNARASIYLEFLPHQKERMRELLEPKGISINYDLYTPLISYIPGVIDNIEDERYDLYAFSYHDVLHTMSATQCIPWLIEASKINPYTCNVTMNVAAARDRGLKDGDTICLENEQGEKIRGRLKTLEGQHPLTVGMVGGMGHWVNDKISRGVGTHFNQLLPGDLKHTCNITLNIETCARVKAYKEGGQE